MMEKIGQSLSYDPDAIIERGLYGTIAFRGSLQNDEVRKTVVKRIKKSSVKRSLQEIDERLIKQIGEQENIVPYIVAEMDDYFLSVFI